MSEEKNIAVIIGGGPAGLTAAYELLDRTEIVPIVLEMDDILGGIARTVEHNGNRIDIGGHRFFSKSDRVMNWWFDFIPIEAGADSSFEITYQNKKRQVDAPEDSRDPEVDDEVMLVRERRSRIYYNRRFFDYPVSLSPQTLLNLGLWRSIKIGFSYLRTLILPIRNPKNLEEFFISRFGRELYETFFESYTEKVWGVPCSEISAEWGAQRVKGLSITKAVVHFLKQLVPGRSRDIAQKGTETSLIEQFLYPKLGPGQMWEVVARHVEERGGRILMRHRADRLEIEGDRIVAVHAEDLETGERHRFESDLVFSTTDIRSLSRALGDRISADAQKIGEGLVFRDFLTVGLLVDELKIREDDGSMVRDNWIYIQEPEVKVGRLQIFNNWSPYLVADPDKVWIGLEYFCDEGDEIWSRDDDDLIRFGADELERIGILDKDKVRDGVVLRIPKTYPAYFGTYERFEELRSEIDAVENLYPIGRNGMHRYNNQDHSMLTAMKSVDQLVSGSIDRDAIWAVNTEDDYHEEK